MSEEKEKVTTDEPEKVTDQDFEGHKLVDENEKVVDRVGTDSEDDDFEAHKLWTDKVTDKVSDV